MKTIKLTYTNPYLLRLNFTKDILSYPVQKAYTLFGMCAEFPNITPITMQGLCIHHEFISAN